MSAIPTRTKLKVAMLVVDANDVSNYTQRDAARQSPVLHNAVHTLLNGLKDRDDIELEIIYGRKKPQKGEDRWEGCLHFIPVSYKIPPVPGIGGSYAGRTWALLQYLKKSKPDLVHAQGTERESGLVAALAQFPSVLTLHGNLTEIAKSMNAKLFSYFGLASRLEQFALGRVSGVHCISTHTQSSVTGKARRTWVIPNAVSSQFFNVQRNPSLHPRVVCMSGISEWKNPILLAQASDALHSEFPGTEVHFHGACDSNRPYGRAFLETIQSRPWCISHGNSDQEVLLSALSQATCAVLPSIMENCPLAVIEALAVGIPCVGSDVGGIPDLIQDRKTGLLFPSDDGAALADCLLEMHRNRALASTLAAAGREDALKRFTAEAVAEAHVQMYREILTTCSDV